MIASSSPRPNRMIVGQIRVEMTSVTGAPRAANEKPRSPRAVDWK